MRIKQAGEPRRAVRIHSVFREERESHRSGHLLFYRSGKECQLLSENGDWGHSVGHFFDGLREWHGSYMVTKNARYQCSRLANDSLT